MKIDIQQIARLMGWLAASYIEEFEWTDGDAGLRLRRGGETEMDTIPIGPKAIGPGLDEAWSAPLLPAAIDIAATAVGVYLDRAPLQSEPMVCLGAQVLAGQLVGLLQAGPILLPVRSARSGVVIGQLVLPGDRVEYQQTVLQLRAIPESSAGEGA